MPLLSSCPCVVFSKLLADCVKDAEIHHLAPSRWPQQGLSGQAHCCYVQLLSSHWWSAGFLLGSWPGWQALEKAGCRQSVCWAPRTEMPCYPALCRELINEPLCTHKRADSEWKPVSPARPRLVQDCPQAIAIKTSLQCRNLQLKRRCKNSLGYIINILQGKILCLMPWELPTVSEKRSFHDFPDTELPWNFPQLNM